MDAFLVLIGLIAGLGAGFFVAKEKLKKESVDADAKAAQIIADAEHKAKHAEDRARHADAEKNKLLDHARSEADSIRTKAEKTLAEAKAEEKELRTKLTESENRIAQREKNLDEKIDRLDKKHAELETRATDIEKAKADAEQYRDQQKTKLEEVAGLSREQAKKQLVAAIEKDSEAELVQRIRTAEEKAEREADDKARWIIGNAIQRYANECTTESTVTLVNLADDSLKGKIIGREGRNITAFEMATGVDVIVDDTPGAVIISGFDLVRRNVAKRALQALLKDGRIHPARIEEQVKKAQKELDKEMRKLADDACIEVGVPGLPDEVMMLLGRLNYRTSYGQNNLKHSIEAAWVGAAMASQLGADVKLAKAACLLHDIGKALTHEVEGGHAVIGAEVLRRNNMPEALVHAVEAHHEDVKPNSVEAFIVMAADCISGARPGARSENKEQFIQRMNDLERIATSQPGVEKVFAIQAGREVRVLVRPEEVDDLASLKMSKAIAKQIESEMNYPGQVKVNVIRETRATAIAA